METLQQADALAHSQRLIAVQGRITVAQRTEVREVQCRRSGIERIARNALNVEFRGHIRDEGKVRNDLVVIAVKAHLRRQHRFRRQIAGPLQLRVQAVSVRIIGVTKCLCCRAFAPLVLHVQREPILSGHASLQPHSQVVAI